MTASPLIDTRVASLRMGLMSVAIEKLVAAIEDPAGLSKLASAARDVVTQYYRLLPLIEAWAARDRAFAEQLQTLDAAIREDNSYKIVILTEHMFRKQARAL